MKQIEKKEFGSENTEIIKIKIGKWYLCFGKTIKTYKTFNEMLKSFDKLLKDKLKK